MSLEKEAKDNILTLRAGNALLEIIPEVGGSITRYCLVTEEQTLNFLRPAQLGFAKHDPREMASFPLIPFSNRIRNSHFKFQEREIKLPLNFYPEVHNINGHGWKVPWTVTESTENRAAIEYQFLPDEWPFSYSANQVFELTDSALTVTLQICNTGESAMPVGLGLQPYFVRTPLAVITAKTEKQTLNFLRPVIQSGIAKHDPREMTSFPLIPFSNRIRNGQFKFQVREIKLPLNFYPEVHSIHGHGWKVPWTVKEKSENKATIEYQFLPDEWPFSYLARQV